MSDSNVSRRDFIQKAAILTGAGLAIGGAAAALKGLVDSPQTTAALSTPEPPASDLPLQFAQLQTSLAAAESELATLRPNYAAALSQNADLQNALTAQRQAADAANAALAEAQAKIEKMSQLVAMYESLDNPGFDSFLQSGLTSAASAFTGALGLLPLVADGAALARKLLDDFDFQIPNFRGGLSWLQKRMDEMNASIAIVEKAILDALKKLDPVATAISQFVNYVLSYLPGAIGAGVKGAFDALTLLYQSLPPTITGTHDQVIQMLTTPFADDDQGYSNALVKPLREKSIAPSEQLAAQVQTANDTYTKSLHGPVTLLIEARAKTLKEIADFRTANQI